MDAPPPTDLAQQRYAALSRQPLHALLFVAPFLLFFHISLIWTPDVLMAHHHLAQIFKFFGATGPLLPALAVIGVLLSQQVIERSRWRIRPLVLGLMTLESVAWAVPLVALLHLLGRLTAGNGVEDSVFMKLVISAGAGIYEEFLFRLVLMGITLLLFVDILELPKKYVAPIMLVAAAIAFSLYHPQVWEDGTLFKSRLLWGPFIFRALAGLYLGGLFLLRGFGVVVGAHTFYNVYVVLVLS